MSRYLSLRDIDWTMILIALIICVVGVMQIFSATLDTSFARTPGGNRLFTSCGGLLLMWIALASITTRCSTGCPMLYLGSLAALLTYLGVRRDRHSDRGAGFHCPAAFTYRYRNLSSW